MTKEECIEYINVESSMLRNAIDRIISEKNWKIDSVLEREIEHRAELIMAYKKLLNIL